MLKRMENKPKKLNNCRGVQDQLFVDISLVHLVQGIK